ncbi:MAG: DMT family transporter [Oscillatoria sp. PMC 1068.18]|nr:DMT family transporter [Oscillatoria sp. PMC 1076.18]MEC4990963.1 DMT family transporter [Oscillatoria sp. PMC 1068.18]
MKKLSIVNTNFIPDTRVLLLENFKQLQLEQSEAIKAWVAAIAYLIVALLLGSIPPVTKMVVSQLTPTMLLTVRYTIAVSFFLPWVVKIVLDRWLNLVWKKPIASKIIFNSNQLSETVEKPPISLKINKTLLRHGCILGLLTYGVNLGCSFGVQTISANRTSFLFGLCVIFVALFDLLYRKRFSFRVFLAAIFALSGSGLMSWEQSNEPLIGSLWVLGAVACESLLLIILEDTADSYDPFLLSLVRLGVVALLSLGVSLNQFSDQLPIIQANLFPLLYLGAATAAIAYLVTFALQTLSAVEAALIQGLEPVFGALISFAVLGEVFGVRCWVGSVLILIGITLAVLASFGGSSKKTYLIREDL